LAVLIAVVIYRIDDQQHRVTVIAIEHRRHGEVYEYTGVNTFVLSWAAERVSGRGAGEPRRAGHDAAGPGPVRDAVHAQRATRG
jgi:hypothetical protein